VRDLRLFICHLGFGVLRFAVDDDVACLGTVRECYNCRARDMSAERHSSDLSKRIRTTPPSPISGGVKPHPPLVGGPGYPGVGPSPHLSTSGTSSTAAVARYVDDDVNFLRDLREINRVERDQIDRDTPIDARIHSTISNGMSRHW